MALASDYNPGTSPCFNLQTVAYFGRKFFGLSAAEALYGVTRAAAHSLRVDAGRLKVWRERRFRRAADRVAGRVRLAVRRQPRARRRERRVAYRWRRMRDTSSVRCARAHRRRGAARRFCFSSVREGVIVDGGRLSRRAGCGPARHRRAFVPQRPADRPRVRQRTQSRVSDPAARLGRRLDVCQVAQRRALQSRSAPDARTTSTGYSCRRFPKCCRRGSRPLPSSSI